MLNIARQIQSGWNTSGQKHPLPEAEVIPVGESANEIKKLEKVTKLYNTLKEHENVPLPGFTLFKNGRKNWGSINPTWLIIDPRGFLVRISNDNLETILHVTGITEGLIQEKCVWARDDTKTSMMLVPVSSPLYIDAVRNTELIEGKVDFKDVKIGDRVILQNELEGTYLGVVSLYGPLDNYYATKEYKPTKYLRRQVIEVEPGKYHYQADLKILKVLQKATQDWTREQSVAHLNSELSIGGYFTNSSLMTPSYHPLHGAIRHISTHAAPKLTMSYIEVDELEAVRLFHDSKETGDCGMLMLERYGKKYLIDYPYFMSSATISLQMFPVMEIEKLSPENILLKQSRNHSAKGKPTFGLDKFTKFYKIVKHVKKESYV